MVVAIAVFTLGASTLASAAPAIAPADTVLHRGVIYTVDSRDPFSRT